MVDQFLISDTFQVANELNHIKSIEKNILTYSFLVITDNNGNYKGILSAIDLLKKPHFVAGDCISKRPQIDIEIKVEEALNILKNSTYTELPVFKNGVFCGVVCKENIIDYLKRTARKKIELSANDIKLKELNLIRDRLYLIIGHDLRSPFNTILGFTSILNQCTLDLSTAQSKKYLNYIHTSAKDALNIVDGLLDWGKSQSNLLACNKMPINLSKLIQKVVAHLYPIASAKNISLNYSIVNKIELHTDKIMLETVLRNLISNAIKFTKIGGEVTLNAISKLNEVQITVSDNGIGINEEKRTLIFNRIIDSETGTANEKGLGLGLFLCKEIVEKLGGKIWIESQEGKGSHFKVSFPIERNMKEL